MAFPIFATTVTRNTSPAIAGALPSPTLTTLINGDRFIEPVSAAKVYDVFGEEQANNKIKYVLHTLTSDPVLRAGDNIQWTYRDGTIKTGSIRVPFGHAVDIGGKFAFDVYIQSDDD